jgi:pimeloyl-ACP methyl ester carboxylesterase
VLSYHLQPATMTHRTYTLQVEPTKNLTWVQCYDGTIECARLQVPLNYSNPEGDSAAIALARIKANVSAESIDYLGPIFFNPGGPGDSGVNMILFSGQNLAKVVGPQFDIVSFDPRGTQRPVASNLRAQSLIIPRF